MRNKKVILSLLIIGIVVLTVGLIYNTFSSTVTVTDIIVTEKGHSDDYKDVWIKAFHPNEPMEVQEEINIIVNERMVWNLIETDKTYFVTYLTRRNGLIILKDIKISKLLTNN
ncbi:hypothetical protein BTR23_14110 [Alkalihalophilus pseudofirmus]|nr:hypothetical protein BTR23_14110 [Alkalihalophilus pseudofirmus]